MKPLHNLPPDLWSAGDFLGTVCGVDIYKEAQFGMISSDYVLVAGYDPYLWDYLYPEGIVGPILQGKLTPAQIESIRAYINLLS